MHHGFLNKPDLFREDDIGGILRLPLDAVIQLRAFVYLHFHL